ncbi:MAG: VCBS repeat-containing protein, partial [Anaerolineales bacterium]|nr:VCBS repeat-containing protein [Anaerolineales bacterium]
MNKNVTLLLAVFSLLWLSLAQGAAASRERPDIPATPAPRAALEDHFLYLPLVHNYVHPQKPVLKWQRGGCYASWCETGWYASPAAVNLDGDPQAEVIAGSYDLVILDGESGALQTRVENENRVWPGIAVADLSGDGPLEIVVGRNDDELTVYDAAGTALWTRHPFGDGEIRSLALADLENDGQIEIIVGRASDGATEQISVYEPNGAVRPGWPARHDGEPGYGWGMYNQNVAAADLDGDDFKEIIGPTDTHYITALDRDGDQLPANSIYDVFNPLGPKVWSQVGVHVSHAVDLRGYAHCGTEHRPNFADSAPTLADLNDDGVREVIVVGNVYNCGTDPYTSLYQMPFVFNGDRSRWSGDGFNWTAIPQPDAHAQPISEDYNTIETAEPNPVIADLDGDGFQEILFASYDGRLHAYWLDKSEHGQWPFEVYHPGDNFFRFASEPAVADLNNDGKAEVLFTSWVQKGSHRTGKLHMLDYLGNVLYELNLPSAVNGNWNGGLAAPTLANIDNDAELELVVLTAHSGVVAYDLPGTQQATILWA